MTVRLCPTERMAPLDIVSAPIADGLLCRQDRLPENRIKLARFRDADRTLDRFDSFDFDFNEKTNRALIHELAAGRFIQQHDDVLFLGPPGTGCVWEAAAPLRRWHGLAFSRKSC